jgi:hypothetical protein
MMPRNRGLKPFLTVLLLLAAWILAPSVLLAADPPAGDGDLVQAEEDLKTLDHQLRKSRTTNDDLIASITVVVGHYKNLKPPAKPEVKPVPDGATDDQKAEIEKANRAAMDDWDRDTKKFEREVVKFRRDVEKVLVKAIQTDKLERSSDTNTRMDVNVAAARAITETAPLRTAEENDNLSNDLRNALERDIFKRKYRVSQYLLDEIFATLGKLNDPASLEWMKKEFIHTKASPEEAVDHLLAAQKSMILFTNVEGALRHDIVERMVTIYQATESAAEQSSNDPKKQSTKQFWDRIKDGAIKVVQYYAGPTARDDQGRAYATMNEFAEWYRAHKNARRPPWLDPEKKG